MLAYCSRSPITTACLAACLAGAVLALTLLAGCTHCGGQCEAGNCPASEVIVKFRPGTTQERIGQIAAELGLSELKTPLEGHHLFRAASPCAGRQALERLKSLPEVEAAQPNYRYRLAK
jgi:hypothetical protein